MLHDENGKERIFDLEEINFDNKKMSDRTRELIILKYINAGGSFPKKQSKRFEKKKTVELFACLTRIGEIENIKQRFQATAYIEGIF